MQALDPEDKVIKQILVAVLARKVGCLFRGWGLSQGTPEGTLIRLLYACIGSIRGY